jgi:hypothetical protein
MQEALRIDSTRADVLADYATYLSRYPDRVQEAVEVCRSLTLPYIVCFASQKALTWHTLLQYFSLAVQANPFNQDLEKKHKAFIDQRAQLASVRNQQEDGSGLGSGLLGGGGLSHAGESVMRIVTRTSRRLTNIGGKGLASSSSLLRADDPSSGVRISAPLRVGAGSPRAEGGRAGDEGEEGDGPTLTSSVSSCDTLGKKDRGDGTAVTSPRSYNRRSLSSSASATLLSGLRLSEEKKEKKEKKKKRKEKFGN